jgi:hypothetical protein
MMALEMGEPEDIAALPPIARGFIEGMQQAVRQKWHEAAVGFLLRAVTNYQTGEACRDAGLRDATIHFLNRSLYYLAQGIYCLGQSERYKRQSSSTPACYVQMEDATLNGAP